jgi:hypothetical protein
MDVFTRAQWRSAGRSARALQAGLDSGDIRRVFHGVYACSDVPDVPETRARAVSLVRPRDTVVGRTYAAWLAGIDVLPPGRSIADEPMYLIVPADCTRARLKGCRGRRAALPEEDVVEQYGVLRTSDARTAIDLGRFAPREQAVAALDAYLNRERVDLEELWRRTRAMTKVRNCRVLRASLTAADAGAQSYAESAERVLFIDAGLPRPSTQISVLSASGELLGFLDMGWLAYRLASEYDGEEHHTSEDDREHDTGRRQRMHRESGWTIDVARKEDLWGRPAALVARTAELLMQRGWSPPDPVLDQISRAAEFEAATGQRWQWMPPDRLGRLDAEQM